MAVEVVGFVALMGGVCGWRLPPPSSLVRANTRVEHTKGTARVPLRGTVGVGPSTRGLEYGERRSALGAEPAELP